MGAQHEHEDEPASQDEGGERLGRRARLRRETVLELKRAALEEVREQGAVGLSLRSVARRMGMSPAGLYRYVASRDDLLTLLITDGYAHLGAYVHAAIGSDEPGHEGPGGPSGSGTADPAVEEAAEPGGAPAPAFVAGPDADVADRLRAVAYAYRSWAVAHPQEFALLFGDPIPGYVAPPGGPTVDAMTSFASALAQPVLEAWHQGRIARLPQLSADVTARLAPLSQLAERAGGVPAPVAALLLLAWGRMHGQISLEVFGHHTWAFPDGCEALFVADTELLLQELGVVDRGPVEVPL